jgi:23S rRNA (uracil1939-C5)-methyltransferase
MRKYKVKQHPVLEHVTIIDAGAEGKSIAKIEDGTGATGLVVFVSNAVPGDVADIQITHRKKNYREGKAIKFHHYSDKRAEAFCSHFGICGGCKWQNMDYSHQLFYKKKQVEDNFRRIGKLDFPEILPILASAKTKFYRNKLEFTFSNKKWLTTLPAEPFLTPEDAYALGFHIPQRFDKIIDIEHCSLQADPSNEIRLAVKKYALENSLTFFDLREQKGLLRNLIIRNSNTGDVMVIVCFFEDNKEAISGLMNFLKTNFSQITSLMFVVNPKKNDTISDLEIQTFSGNSFIVEEMEGIRYKVGPKSFFQTNSEQAFQLYKITRNFAALTGNELVYDLYTGTGSIANFVAKQAKKVVGIEYIEAAIADAKENSKNNQIHNTVFFAGDMKDVLSNDFIEQQGRPDVIITDPPRAGMHEDVTKRITEIGAERIVYVSCNPATQARDLAIMSEKYNIVKVQPVDMFPHTHHVECVVLLERKK